MLRCMGRFDGVFERAAPQAAPATQSVQSSLYRRLVRTHGKAAGDVGWMLVRAAQPGHRDHRSAVQALQRLELPSLRELSTVVAASARAMGAREDCAALCRRISAALRKVEEDDGFGGRALPDQFLDEERAELDSLIAAGEGIAHPRVAALMALVGRDGFRVGS